MTVNCCRESYEQGWDDAIRKAEKSMAEYKFIFPSAFREAVIKVMIDVVGRLIRVPE